MAALNGSKTNGSVGIIVLTLCWGKLTKRWPSVIFNFQPNKATSDYLNVFFCTPDKIPGEKFGHLLPPCHPNASQQQKLSTAAISSATLLLLFSPSDISVDSIVGCISVCSSPAVTIRAAAAVQSNSHTSHTHQALCRLLYVPSHIMVRSDWA